MEELLQQYKHIFPENIQQQIDVQATFLIGELLFIIFSLVCLIHAFLNGKKHVTVWFSSIISGTVNDLFFMALPFVDNFFHCQAIIMITPRLPLYIPCAYVSFMYICIISSWNLNLSNLGKSAAAAISGATFYAMYDLTGVRFLWWTWHTTDAAIFERWHSVPFGSTTWTLVHLFVLAMLLNKYVLSSRSNSVFFTGISITAIFTTPLMMITMGICQMYQLRLNIFTEEFPFFKILQIPGKPDQITFAIVVILLVLIFLTQKWDTKKCLSTGVHQTIGDCGEIEYDLSNYERKKYYCPQVENQDFVICEPKFQKQIPEGINNKEWYTICGKHHDIIQEDGIILSFLYVFGLIQYCLMLCNNKQQQKQKQI